MNKNNLKLYYYFFKFIKNMFLKKNILRINEILDKIIKNDFYDADDNFKLRNKNFNLEFNKIKLLNLSHKGNEINSDKKIILFLKDIFNIDNKLILKIIYFIHKNKIEKIKNLLEKLRKKNQLIKNLNNEDILKLIIIIYKIYIIYKILYNNNNKQMKLQLINKKKIKKKKSLKEMWWNSKYTEKIKIYDNFNNSMFEFAIEESNNNELILLNKNQIELGKVEEWVDTEDLISKEYKNNENNILDPETQIPLLNYNIYEEKKIYHGLRPGIYRKYEYSDLNKIFIRI